MAVARFSLIGRSKAAEKGPINHEFVNLAAEFANISRTIIGKSDRVAESRDRGERRLGGRWSRRSIKYRPFCWALADGLPRIDLKKLKRRKIQETTRYQDWIIQTDSLRFAVS